MFWIIKEGIRGIRMKSVEKFIFIILSLAVLLISCSADEEQRQPRAKLPFDSALMKTSPVIAQTKARIDYRGEFFCGEKTEQGTIRKEVTAFKNLCAFYTAIQNSTEVTFNEIRVNGLIRRPLYVFSVFELVPRDLGDCNADILTEASNCDAYMVVDIGGPYLSMESCAAVEPLAWKFDISIQRCHEWKEPFVIAEKLKAEELESKTFRGFLKRFSETLLLLSFVGALFAIGWLRTRFLTKKRINK